MQYGTVMSYCTGSAEQINVPVALNSLLYPHCAAVVVSPNFETEYGESICMHGMECSQYEIAGKVYNIALLLKHD